MADLTDMQDRFVEEYLVDLNASAAARRAGYKNETYGRELLTKTHVKEAIAEKRKEQQERTQITQDLVLEGLLKEAQRKDTQGGNTNARISAYKALGKHLGLFVERTREEGEQRIIVEYVEKGED